MRSNSSTEGLEREEWDVEKSSRTEYRRVSETSSPISKKVFQYYCYLPSPTCESPVAAISGYLKSTNQTYNQIHEAFKKSLDLKMKRGKKRQKKKKIRNIPELLTISKDPHSYKIPMPTCLPSAPNTFSHVN